jgi:hypothetical protein
MRVCVLALCALLFPAYGSTAQTAAWTPADTKITAQWLAGLQFTNPRLPSFGAIRVHHTTAAVGADGRNYFRVSPYIGNLAALGFLRSHRPEALPIVERWIDWWFAHLNAESAPDGVPFEHFYLQDGSGETVCVKPGDPHLCRYNDATDSAAATFFALLLEYQQAGGHVKPEQLSSRSEKIDKLGKTLLALQNPDGLFWAKTSYRAKYLEDNCEVYAGLIAMGRLATTVFRDPARAALAAAAAKRLRTGIETTLFDTRQGRFLIAKFEDNTVKAPDLSVWYPDVQAQFWPLLWGVSAPSDANGQAAMAILTNIWNGREHPDWAAHPERVNAGWISTDVAYASTLAGDRRRIPEYLRAVKRLKITRHDRFAWPFTAADAGWLLAIVGTRTK